MQLTIEQLQKFNVTSEMIELGLSYNGVDLVCDDFSSYEKQKLKHAISMFDIHGLGGKAYSVIGSMLTKPIEFLTLNQQSEKLEILRKSIGKAKTKILVDGIQNLTKQGIPLWKIISCFMIDDCGVTTAKQFSNYLTTEVLKIHNISYSFDGLQKSVISELRSIENEILQTLQELQMSGINIKYPEGQKIILNSVFYVMTGSPKNSDTGAQTKSDFSKRLPENWIEQKALNSETTYLITDDVDSKSSKMQKAKKLGCSILTYEDVVKFL